ncbi:MAG: hypothetical protein P1U68_00495 [Verrucomicrobiales bacterium]|nr:hypothetical protein [Verrucomicrobiales bacterium]
MISPTSSHPSVIAGVVGAFAILVAAPSLAPGDESVPERIDLSNFPGEIVDKIVVPIPAEIFAVLDKLDEPEWKSAVELPESNETTTDRAILALTFGSLVGEGFIAVQAKSGDDIQQIGRRVLALSESLGLASAVQPHSLSIIDEAADRNWEGVREELDATQQTVRMTMEKLRDDELSGLVSLGGWLRGTHVVTSFISDSFSEDKAELLNQPGLITYFREMLESMSGPSKSSPQIRAISTGLARLEAIVSDGEVISEEDINDMRDISQAMLEQYYFEEAES